MLGMVSGLLTNSGPFFKPLIEMDLTLCIVPLTVFHPEAAIATYGQGIRERQARGFEEPNVSTLGKR